MVCNNKNGVNIDLHGFIIEPFVKMSILILTPIKKIVDIFTC